MNVRQESVLPTCLMEVFPAVVWEAVLMKVEDYEDVLNILEICPQMEVITRGKEFSWWIGDIIPLILPKYLRMREIKTCRLVSFRWKHAMDNPLKTFPKRLPYNSCSLAKMTENHFNYNSRRGTSCTDFHEFACSTGYLEGLSEYTNPFPGGSVGVSMYEFGARHSISYPDHPPVHSILDFLPVFQRFGRQINEISFNLGRLGQTTVDDWLVEKIKQIFLILSHLTQLKSLTLFMTGFEKWQAEQKCSAKVLDAFTGLSIPASLETLKLAGFENKHYPCEICKHLITVLANPSTLMKLSLDTDYYLPFCGELLPNLNDLSLGMRSMVDLKTSFESTTFSNLRKLSIWSLHELEIFTLFGMLTSLKVESLDVSGVVNWNNESTKEFEKRIATESETTSYPRQACDDVFNKWNVPTIQNLNITAYGGTRFSFLRCLPSLHFLIITIKLRPPGIGCNPPGWTQERDMSSWGGPSRTNKDTFADCLGTFVRSFCLDETSFSCIWNEFHELKMITIHAPDEWPPLIRQFVRECPQKMFTASRL